MKLVLGFAIGVALGLVFAPASGERTRAQLKNKARDLTRYPERKAHEKVREVARETGGEQVRSAAVSGGTSRKRRSRRVTSEVLKQNEPGQTA